MPKPEEEWKRGDRGVETMGYQTMSLDELEAMRVQDVVERDAHLYLWTTNAFMVEAHSLARAWGFKPKTILTWVKVQREDPLRPSMRVGYHFRGATEHVIFGVRGSLRLLTREGLPTAYLWPRESQHSRKPEAFYDLVEQASPGPYLELFSRRNRLGWDTWGDEAFNQVEIHSQEII